MKLPYYSAIAAVLLLLSGTLASSQTVIQHLGATDPLAQGFTFSSGSGNAQFGAVYDDFGYDAWSINPRSGSEFGFYTYSLSTEEMAAAATNGWILSARVRFVSAPEGNLLRFYGNGAFTMTFSATENGDPVISVQNYGEHQYVVEGGGADYNQYAFVYDPALDSVAVWINGIERISDLRTGDLFSEPHLMFGAGQAITHSYWNEVNLTIVPEPSTVALLVGVGLFLGTICLRRMHRSTRSEVQGFPGQ